MEKLSEYKKIIESLHDYDDFEKRGDDIFLTHPDPLAREYWAFYRPSGSHPEQISDSDVRVAIMAFNQSRLSGYERFTKLNQEVINSEELRQKISNRARMIFRALADNDFTELVSVIEIYGVYLPLCVNQVIHGRKMNDDVILNPHALNRFFELSKEMHSKELFDSIFNRIVFDSLNITEIGKLLDDVGSVQNIFAPLKQRYISALDSWIEQNGLHKLQQITLRKKLA